MLSGLSVTGYGPPMKMRPQARWLSSAEADSRVADSLGYPSSQGNKCISPTGGSRLTMTTSAIAQMLQFQIHCFEQFLGAMAPGFQCLSSYMKLRRKINEMEHSFNIVSWSSGPTNNIFCFVYFSVSLVDFPDIDLTPYVMQWVTQTPIWKGWNALFILCQN